MIGIFKQFLDSIRFGNGLADYGRYYGLYRGKVMDTLDPTNQGKIAVNVPEITQDSTKSLANPAFPLHPVMADFPPEVGDPVWVLFEDGRKEFPVWIGHWWTKQGTGMARPSDLNPASGESPSVRFFSTKSGHRLVFEDKAGSEEVRIEHMRTRTPSTPTRIRLRPSGDIEIEVAGQAVLLGDQTTLPPAVGPLDKLATALSMDAAQGHIHLTSQGPSTGPLAPTQVPIAGPPTDNLITSVVKAN